MWADAVPIVRRLRFVILYWCGSKRTLRRMDVSCLQSKCDGADSLPWRTPYAIKLQLTQMFALSQNPAVASMIHKGQEDRFVAPAPAYTALVERIKSLRASLHLATDPDTRNSLLDSFGAATTELAQIILEREGWSLCD